MEFRKYLEQTSKRLDQQVQDILNQWLKEVGKIDRKLVPLAKAFIQANFGGKRIRGSLVKLGYEIASSPSTIAQGPRNDVVRVGAAYEIFHTAILVHDDIIDESPTRRGQKSLYKKVGVSQAITLADYGFFLAVKIISESEIDMKSKIKAVNFFSQTVIDTAIGQMLDIAQADPKITNKLKTARYTIAAPLQLGAILGGAEQELISLFGELGENLGIAFQIKDDILDGEVTSLDYAKALAYISEGKKLIPQLTKDPKMSKLLEQMADYLVQRNK